MAFRDFSAETAISRRSLLRGGAMLGGAAALSGLPFAHSLLAQTRTSWPNVAALIDTYGDGRKLANIMAVLGWGQQAPVTIGKGNLAIGQNAPVGLDSLYRVYSMTKPVTGMAVMMLIDEGRLGLDQPLAEVLPKFANMQVQRTYDGSITDLVPAERPVTIRHLLTHTAGIGYPIIQKGPIREAYMAKGVIAGQVSKLPLAQALFGRGEPVRSLAAFADNLASLPLVYQPGTRFSYSTSIDLLGRLIEVVSGQKFDAFLTENIFKPAGMNSTWFRVPASEVGRLTTNYGVMNGVLVPLDPARASIYLDPPAFPSGGAGLVSSPRDFDRFLRMLLGYGVIDGKRVMGELAVRVGTSNILPDTVDTKGSWIEGQGFGAGGRVTEGSFGWGGAAGTVAFVNMKAGLRASLFTQYMPSDAYPLHTAFPAAVVKDLQAMRKG
ncbi:MAG: serine hydrolase domain-containing protein [Qipengyuania sp.]